MSSYLQPKILAFVAGADLSSLKNTFVKFGSTEKLVVGCGNDERPQGILMNAPKAGEVAEVAVEGGALLKSSGVIGKGASVASAAGGQGKAVTSGFAYCTAQEDAVANDVIPVIIDRHVGVAV